MSVRWLRKAAENGHADSCKRFAARMYGDLPYAREVGHVGEAAEFATSTRVMEGHDVSPEVLTSVIYWLRKGEYPIVAHLNELRRRAQEGAIYCVNEGCEFLGQVKDFKVCPQCKIARYCGDTCQRQDWNAGGHKDKCASAAWI